MFWNAQTIKIKYFDKELNNNIGCFEIEWLGFYISTRVMLNNNIGCFEMKEENDKRKEELELNNNIGCFEIERPERIPSQVLG